MKETAEKFLKELREGNINGAVKVVEESLNHGREALVEEKRIELMKQYGFELVEAKDDDSGASDDDQSDDEDKKDKDDNEEDNSDEE